MTKLSFVIPCYRSEKTIEKVIEEIVNTVNQKKEYDYEIICVNDCSPDNVYDILLKLSSINKKVKVINLAKNSGKHSAVIAGYNYCDGDIVINLDDDCQCPVYETWNLIAPIENEGYDITTAKYYEKKESLFKRVGSNLNNRMSHILLNKPLSLRFENFSASKKFVVDEIVKYKNPYPYLEGLFLRTTRKIKAVPMEERDRGDDNSTGFTFGKSLSLAINGMTAFSVIPLRIATFCGTLFAVVGSIYGLYIIIHKLLNPLIVMGYSSVMATMLFSFGLIMMMLGLIGEYVGRIYICINDSPQFVIKNMINFENEK